MKMEQIECSETSAYKIQTPGNHPEENIQLTYLCLFFRLLVMFLCNIKGLLTQGGILLYFVITFQIWSKSYNTGHLIFSHECVSERTLKVSGYVF
jgi:hypothetical protein